jgi:hypothetical protein
MSSFIIRVFMDADPQKGDNLLRTFCGAKATARKLPLDSAVVQKDIGQEVNANPRHMGTI